MSNVINFTPRQKPAEPARTVAFDEPVLCRIDGNVRVNALCAALAAVGLKFVWDREQRVAYIKEEQP